jgi:NADPH:quinone reductase-like Zn-dependent oxidoreductase
MEAVGEVVALGSGVQSVRVGAPVGFSAFGAYAEFMNVPERLLVPLPSLEARWLTVLVSGITASVALAEVAQMTRGETVLVTAAAGGTGLFAVQLAKAAGNRVIGTCSSREVRRGEARRARARAPV